MSEQQSTERIFHCTEGNTHKFWRVRVDGETQYVRFGRIGTEGQEHAKSFESAAAARAAADRLIAQKLGKGYIECPA